MSDGGWRSQWDVFHRALEREPEDRLRLVDVECDGDEELRARVARLLAAHDRLGPLDRPSPSEQLSDDAYRDPLVGERIGGYRISGLLGEGGQGIVYAAEQSTPRRTVALKLIRLGLDTAEVVRRFEAEKQALAILNHPAIAQVFDAGVTADGRPYFVMELVHGEPITQYCDHRRLDVVGRIRLFLDVCEGVQHAHRRGILHRDLKPSNLLISDEDGRAVSKVIDFGIAKATASGEIGEAESTALGSWLGTPEYMSPEQASGEADLDTRVDVYALGIVLYQLLVGVLPFVSAEQAVRDQKPRRILEQDLPRPSLRLGGLEPADRDRLGHLRRAEPGQLRRRLHGDLDWIVAKAIARDRERRYGSVQELADDLRRHLALAPVLAGPPSVRYVAAKFVQRHRLGVTVGLGVLALAMVAVIGLLVQAGRLAVERDRANREAARAVRAATTSEEVTEFLIDIFRTSSPNRSMGEAVTARELLDRGADRVRGELAGQPLVQARLMSAIGTVYRQLGLLREALELEQEGLTLRQRVHGEDNLEIAASMEGVGSTWFALADYAAARAALEEALRMREALLDPSSPEIARNAHLLANVYEELGDYEAAFDSAERAVAILKRALGPDEPAVAEAVATLAGVLGRLGRLEESRDRQLEAVAMLESAYGAEDPRLGDELNDLAITFWELEDFERSRYYLERSLRLYERSYGPGHPSVAALYNNLGRLQTDLGDYEEARANLVHSLELRREIFGPDNPETAVSVLNLGRLLGYLGDYEEARRLYRLGIDTRERLLGPHHPSTAMAYEGLALMLRQAGDLEAAAAAEAKASAIRSADPALGSP